MSTHSQRILAKVLLILMVVSNVYIPAALSSNTTHPLHHPEVSASENMTQQSKNESTITTPQFNHTVFIPYIRKTHGFIENVAERTPNRRVYYGYKNDVPIKKYEQFIQDIYYLDEENNKWEEIDSTLVQADPHTYKNTAGAFSTEFTIPVTNASTRKQATDILKISGYTGNSLAFATDSMLSLKHVELNTIIYSQPDQQRDIIYSVHPWGVKEDIILYNKESHNIFSLSIKADHLNIEKHTDGSWHIQDNNHTIWRILEPFGTDAHGVPAQLSASLTQINSGEYTFEVIVDETWLNAQDRAFPVTIDPSIVNNRFVSSETYVQQSSPDLPSYKQRNRFLGYDYTYGKAITRIFVPFDQNILPDSVQNNDILSAKLVFHQYIANHSGLNTSVYELQSGWNDLSLTWNNQPQIGNRITNSWVSPVPGEQTWDLTEWIKRVRNGDTPNNGFSIRADNETAPTGIFWSSHCDPVTMCIGNTRPYFQIEVVDNPVFGNGSSGDVTVASGQTTVINTVRSGIRAQGTQAFPAHSTGFATGDLIVLHQTKGVTNAGHWEFNRIKSINSPTNWTLESPVMLEFLNSGDDKAQVVKVPQFNNVVVEPDAILTAPKWDGTTGGILVFKAAGTVDMAGTVLMQGAGYRGGAGGHRQAGIQDPARSGIQGESTRGNSIRSSDANHTGGGAGLADLAAGDGGGGGGGGSYATPGTNGTIDSIHPGQTPGLGATAIIGTATMNTSIYPGGAGGGGGADDDPLTIGGDGGNGGGIAIIYGHTINSPGTINASGTVGQPGSQEGKDGSGGGGGGAGGSIRIVTHQATIDGLTTQGGVGGTRGIQSGRGGNGGEGRTRVEYCDSFAGTAAAASQISSQQINCSGLGVSSNFNPLLDTWNIDNREGQPSYELFASEYGITNTATLITETRILEVISDTSSLSLPITFEPASFTATMSLTVTDGLTITDATTGTLIPKPIPYAYEETVVTAIYDDEFAQSYTGALEGGLCAGMAATVADFATDDGPSVTTYGGTDTVRSIPDNDPALDFIQRYHGRQVSSQVLNWLSTNGRTTPANLYATLLGSIGTPEWQANPMVIGILKGSGCKDIEIGHALLPYKVEPRTGGLARIYVYDPNYVDSVADAHYIEVNIVSNTWSYELAPATETNPAIRWTGSFLYTTPLSIFREKPKLPTNADDIVFVDGIQRYTWGVQRYTWGDDGYGSSNVKTTDNTHTGCIDTGNSIQFVQEISRSLRLVPFTGDQPSSVFPDTLFLPAHQELTFTGTGSESANIGDMTIFGPHALAGLITTADQATHDQATLDADFKALTIQTTDQRKLVTAYQMQETEQWTRIYAVSNISLAHGELLTITVAPDLGSFEVINQSPVTKTFDLGVGHIGSTGVSNRIHEHQLIGPFERRIYTPVVWEEVAHSPLIVEIDYHNDGTIDQLEFVGGQIFPAAIDINSIPDAKGTEFTMLAQEFVAPGHIGWINLDYPLKPGQKPTNKMNGNDTTLRRWLSTTDTVAIYPQGGFVGIPGVHGGLFQAINNPTPGAEDLYHVGDIMLVPTYTTIIGRQGSQPMYYKIHGVVAVEITQSSGQNECKQQSCKSVTGKLLFK